MIDLLALLDDDALVQRVNGQNSLRVGDLLAVDEDAALLDKLAEYKKSLIFEYVTGKREVPSCWNR